MGGRRDSGLSATRRSRSFPACARPRTGTISSISRSRSASATPPASPATAPRKQHRRPCSPPTARLTDSAGSRTRSSVRRSSRSRSRQVIALANVFWFLIALGSVLIIALLVAMVVVRARAGRACAAGSSSSTVLMERVWGLPSNALIRLVVYMALTLHRDRVRAEGRPRPERHDAAHHVGAAHRDPRFRHAVDARRLLLRRRACSSNSTSARATASSWTARLPWWRRSAGAR